MSSKALMSALGENHSIGFSLPTSYPVKELPSCKSSKIKVTGKEDRHEDETPTDDVKELLPSSEIDEISKATKGKQEDKIVVDSQVRKSPQLKVVRQGFKSPQCKDKNCLGCMAKPPSLSSKTIRKLGSSLCDIDYALLTNMELSKKKKSASLVGTKSPSGKRIEDNVEDDNSSEKV